MSQDMLNNWSITKNTMQKIIFLLAIVALIAACKAPADYITLDGHTFKSYAAPGVKKIFSNFYADERELSNIDYREFMFWMKRVFGENSTEYSAIIPDTSVWNYQSYYDSLQIKYFQDPAYESHPFVGISLEQAKIYSDWRTDRVAEMILIRKKLIKPNVQQNRDNYFTIEKYLEGKYEATVKVNPIIVLPKYTIPTVEEWEILSGVNSNFKYGLDSLDKHNRALLKTDDYLFNTKERFVQEVENLDPSKKSKIQFVPTVNANYGYKNIYGLKNTIGNVSELVNESGVSKGGDWFHSLKDTDLKEQVKTNIPNCWTGFRNVCRLEVRRKK